jgi:ATP-binding cassette subfamily B protein
MEVRFEGVSIRATGHTLLEGIDLSIAPGEHVAVLGPSGAGKSTLLGALLGWHVPSQGRITIDGLLLDPTRLQRLRRESAWIDPSVRVWNRSLLENLRYGAPDDAPLERALADADLLGVLEDLPAGLQTALGEAGRLLSGGEGQRVRLGRGMARGDARLVLLDEPFRGLDRDLRRDLLARARALWKDATLLCVLHDVRDAFAFDRAVVLNRGGIVESGAPEALASQAGSLLGALLAAEDALAGAYRGWRRLHLSGGRLREESDP